jgi:hypothetical protein
MTTDVILKTVNLQLNENEVCILDSIMNLIFSQHAGYVASRSDIKDLRGKITSAVEEII